MPTSTYADRDEQRDLLTIRHDQSARPLTDEELDELADRMAARALNVGRYVSVDRERRFGPLVRLMRGYIERLDTYEVWGIAWAEQMPMPSLCPKPDPLPDAEPDWNAIMATGVPG